jgi:hypothetical protein
VIYLSVEANVQNVEEELILLLVEIPLVGCVIYDGERCIIPTEPAEDAGVFGRFSLISSENGGAQEDSILGMVRGRLLERVVVWLLPDLVVPFAKCGTRRDPVLSPRSA